MMERWCRPALTEFFRETKLLQKLTLEQHGTLQDNWYESLVRGFRGWTGEDVAHFKRGVAREVGNDVDDATML